MKSTVDSARRRLFLTAGAALSAPLVVTGEGVAGDDDPAGLAARLAALEDANAIRSLNCELARRLSAGAPERLAALFAEPDVASLEKHIRSLAPDPSAGDDVIELAADGERAVARLPCIAEIETPIEPVCPLVEMARAQGGGVVRRPQRGVIEAAYVKRGGLWKIERLEFRAA